MNAPDIERLRQEREIIALTVRYAWAIDHRRFEELADVFAPDATADYGRLGFHQGPRAIGAAVAGALARFDRTQHIVANHQVTIEGDQAQGRCYFQAQHVITAPGGDRNHTVAGDYLDRFRLTADGWRIAARELRVTWTDDRAAATEE